MPELPEVETVRRDLERYLVGKPILSVQVFDSKVASASELSNELIDQTIIAVNRRGKLLMLELSTGNHLLAHLKMTGQLIYRDESSHVGGGHSLNSADDWGDRFTRAIITFAHGAELRFNDLRRFGYLKISSTLDRDRYVSKTFGIEPLTPNFTWENFRSLFRKQKTNLKAFLLNQKNIAGLGNIYVDEVCFYAGVLPSRTIESIKQSELKRLFAGINQIIQSAVEHRGTTFKNFLDSDGQEGNYASRLKVFDRKGKPCLNCQTPIEKIRLAGRGTHFCPNCQG